MAVAIGVDGQGPTGGTPCGFVAHDHLRGTGGRAWRRAAVAADQPFVTIRNLKITYSSMIGRLADQGDRLWVGTVAGLSHRPHPSSRQRSWPRASARPGCARLSRPRCTRPPPPDRAGPGAAPNG